MIRKIIRIDEDRCNGCGLQRAAENALRNRGENIPRQVVAISCDGSIPD